ncbi:hypothetical protein AX17_005512 [Amanita inopinata Kibby_2008]|nr:hypothetical protein AX17_005512 [Amanita inopinata Kibby_2008]
MINEVSFVVFNTERMTLRTAGPFGNANHSNEGKNFYITSPMAISGYAVAESHLGLSGLSFIKAVGNL